MKIYEFVLLFAARRAIYGTFSQILILILEGIFKKNFLWASRQWVCRRKEPILGYVPKQDEKNSGGKWLTHLYENFFAKCPKLGSKSSVLPDNTSFKCSFIRRDEWRLIQISAIRYDSNLSNVNNHFNADDKS